MKAFTILCLFVIAVSAFAAPTNDLNLEEVFAELKNTELGEMVFNFATVQSQMEDSRYTALFEALDLLKKSLANAEKKEHELYEKQTAHHKQLVAEFKHDIAVAVTTQRKLTKYLTQTLLPTKREAEKNIAAGERAIKHANAQKKAATELRNSRHATFEKNVKDLTEAIDAITRAVPILEGLRSSKSMMMFVETNKESMTEVANALTDSFKSMSLQYTVIPELIQSMLQGNFVDQAMLERIIKKLGSLKVQFQGALSHAQATEKAEVAAYKKHVANLNAQIASAQKIVRENTDLLNKTLKEIKKTREGIAQAKQDEATARKNLKEEIANFASITHHHKELVAQLEKEQAVVEKVVTHLHNHGIAQIQEFYIIINY